jgi:hypothetical protein
MERAATFPQLYATASFDKDRAAVRFSDPEGDKVRDLSTPIPD